MQRFFQWFVDFHKNLLTDCNLVEIPAEGKVSPSPRIALTDDGAHQASYSGVTDFFPRRKAAVAYC